MFVWTLSWITKVTDRPAPGYTPARRDEQTRCLRDIERHQEVEQSYMDEGVRILELVRNAQSLLSG